MSSLVDPGRSRRPPADRVCFLCPASADRERSRRRRAAPALNPYPASFALARYLARRPERGTTRARRTTGPAAATDRIFLIGVSSLTVMRRPSTNWGDVGSHADFSNARSASLADGKAKGSKCTRSKARSDPYCLGANIPAGRYCLRRPVDTPKDVGEAPVSTTAGASLSLRAVGDGCRLRSFRIEGSGGLTRFLAAAKARWSRTHTLDIHTRSGPMRFLAGRFAQRQP